MQSRPDLTTGQDFLHSCLHFLGLHLSELTMAILVNLSAMLVDEERRDGGDGGDEGGGGGGSGGVGVNDVERTSAVSEHRYRGLVRSTPKQLTKPLEVQRDGECAVVE